MIIITKIPKNSLPLSSNMDDITREGDGAIDWARVGCIVVVYDMI